MKFRVSSTNWYEVDEMIEQYPCLINFGFEIEKKEEPKYQRIKDENGKILMFEYDTRVTYIPYVTIDDIDSLIRFSKAVDCSLVFNGKEPYIEIYDGYRE